MRKRECESYLEGIEPRGSYNGADGFFYEQNRIPMLLLLGDSVGERFICDWHDVWIYLL